MILDRNAFDIWSFIAKRAFKAKFLRPKDNEAAKAIRKTLRETNIAVYIHIPFCTGTCTFCPYARISIHKSGREKIIEKYINALLREMTIYSKITENLSLKVIDIHAGGGTPSLIPGKYWKMILEKLSELFEAEPKIAIEANPEDLRDETYTFNLVESGVNEVSLGVQSFNSKILKTLGRRHSVEDSIKAIENLRSAGCEYINIDLMYMVPGQTLEEWIKDLEIASQQDVDEITCYPTLITPHSIGYKLIKKGKIPTQPSKKIFKKMVYACEDILPLKGFKGVEIYGYSRRKEWKYVTVNYEMEGPLLGFGCGAMGFTGGYEYVNTHSVKNYINSVLNDRLPIAGAREVALFERAIRYTVCRLFVCRVLNKKDFKLKFNREFNELIGRTSFSKALYLLKITGDIREDNERILLTRKGLFTAHKICWAFVLNVPCRIAEEYLKIPWPLKVVVP